MNRNLYGYNGILEHKAEKNKARRIKLSIFGFILMIIAFIAFVVTFIILNQLNSNSIREKTIIYNKEKIIGYSKEEFINVIKDKAIDNYQDYGVLPSVTMAQAILESSYGNSKLASKYNNLFGIKANEDYKGDVVTFETNENHEDVIVAAFRVYDNFDESIKDHGKFLKENIRYTEYGFFEGINYKEQAQALEDAGYATVKDEEGNRIYAELLIEVIEENNLTIYD